MLEYLQETCLYKQVYLITVTLVILISMMIRFYIFTFVNKKDFLFVYLIPIIVSMINKVDKHLNFYAN